jgi:putative peptidoglycan lipid II flippase
MHPAVALAVGTLVGGLLQAIVQWPPLWREGYRFRFQLAPADPGLREILLLMVPATLGLAAVQINQFVNTVLATGEGTGAVSWLNYAFRLMYLPIGLFGVSIATATTPVIARLAAQSDQGAVRKTIADGLTLMLMLNVPATVGLIVLARPIVSVIFERGAFTAADTAATAGALAFYAPGLLGYSTVKIASPTFYALRDSRTPVIVSVLSVACNVVLILTLVRELGYRGLALVTALSALLNPAVLLWLLRRRIGGFDEGRVAQSLLKILVASGVMAGAVLVMSAWLPTVWDARGLAARGTRLAVTIFTGLLVLGVMARVLRIAEFSEAVRRVRGRIGGARR